jgi:hypothetical protein
MKVDYQSCLKELNEKHEHMEPYEDEYVKMRNKGFDLKKIYDGIRNEDLETNMIENYNFSGD